MAFFGDILLFSFCLLDTGCLLFILIYFIITLSDLECDYLNAQECCAKLNFWNVPRLWCQILIPICLLLSGHWLLLLANVPISFFLLRRFIQVPKGNEGEYDSTEIHDKGMLRKHITGVSLHLAWQMIGFFMFLYCLLEAVMNEPVGLQQDDDVTVLNRPAAQALYQPRHSTAQDTMDDEI